METTKPAKKKRNQRKKKPRKKTNTSSPWSNGCSEERAKSIFLTGPDIPTHLLNKALNTRGFFKSTAKLSPSATPYKPPTSEETKQETTKKSEKKSKTKKKKRKKKIDKCVESKSKLVANQTRRNNSGSYITGSNS